MRGASGLARDTTRRCPVSSALTITRTGSVDLGDADLDEICDLRCRASDFFAEVEEDPPTPQSFQADLDDLPEGYSRSDECIYRTYSEGLLLGYAEVLRGFDRPDQWTIGMLLVDPVARSSGVGHAMVEAVASDARADGARSLMAGVITARERSMAFWRREGFVREVRRRPVVFASGQESAVVRLECDLQQASLGAVGCDEQA
jgi:GNAT superfamily N-acetyltransferase